MSPIVWFFALLSVVVFGVRWGMGKWVNRRISIFQNNLLEKHFLEVEAIYKQMRGWKHDYHNHIQLMHAYLEMGRYEEMKTHLDELLEDSRQLDTVLKTGNIMVDAILNSKISYMNSHEILVNAKATVPKEHAISNVDLCAILGNLLDNAIEANLKINQIEDRFIRIYLRPMKGHLYLSVTNASNGKPMKGFLSSKRKGQHGFGLKRIDLLVGKYGGFVNRQFEEGVFATEISLPFVQKSAPLVKKESS